MNRAISLIIPIALSGCLVGDETKPMTYDEFVAAHVSQDQDEEGNVHLSYDWDVPIQSLEDVDQLYAAYRLAHETGAQVSESIVMSRNGRDVIWPANLRQNLSYCVSNTFGARKAAVVNAMASATGAWQTATSGRVRFVHAAAQDASCNNRNTAVLFNVVPIQQNSGLFARAFFPNEGRANRQLLINLTNAFAAKPAFPLVGILRHELGHALGLRHETIRRITALEFGNQCLEDLFFRDVTKVFDDESVMITPACMGIAEVKESNPSLTISFFDNIGIKRIYP